ncbi:MAG: glycoside hydrolase family 20 zincin-like fold domain-containing protein [Phycisphaerae bacterium]
MHTFAKLVITLGGVVILGCSELPRYPELVPPPQRIQWAAEPPLAISQDSVTIVLGTRATAPEKHAAELLQDSVSRRFGQKWPVVEEGGVPVGCETVILLGQRSSSDWLERLCKQKQIDLRTAAPGHDNYIIEIFDDHDGKVVVVGGGNPRGVIYGQDTLFQMLRERAGRLELVRASVCDWASIPWRGRPQTNVELYLRPGELDCYLRSRINFVDLRNGIYAFEPSDRLDEPLLSRAIGEIHRRGMLVYGTVNTGVSETEYDKAIAMFERFIALGADGLWVSFDDKGPGDKPEEIVRRVLELGNKHGITGERIAITPPKGAYQDISAPFNRKIMAVPGMESALWFWTRYPCDADVEAARSIGLKVLPSWWHNYPRTLNSHDYTGIPPLAMGWHGPGYELLADAGCQLTAVMPWGGNAWGQYYVVPVIGWWSWNPKAHDWRATRRRIHGFVFGENQAAAAADFDETLAQIRPLLHYAVGEGQWQPASPPRLKDPAERRRAMAIVDRLEALLMKIKRAAPARSMLDADQLQAGYLSKMEKEVATLRAAAALPFPEYWWIAHQRAVLDAVYDENVSRVERLTAAVREPLLRDLDEISQKGRQLGKIDDYVKWWTQQANLDSAGWKNLVEKRREELVNRLADYNHFVKVRSDMLKGLADPPVDWGTGRWEYANLVRATAAFTEREQYWGNWIAGLCDHEGSKVAAFATSRRTPAAEGEFAELELVLPIAGDRHRLALLVYLADVNKESIGLHYVKWRWADYRRIQLLHRDEVLWEADIGVQREQGEWFMVKLPPVPETMKQVRLRLRVENLRGAIGNQTLALVGPIRLIELPKRANVD